MNRICVAIVCAVALAAAACAGGTGPTTPAVADGQASAAASLSKPATAGAGSGLVRAIANCRGPVLDVLKSALGASSVISISDNGTVLSLTFTSAGDTANLAVTYLDNDGSGSLTCGDTITGVF